METNEEKLQRLEALLKQMKEADEKNDGANTLVFANKVVELNKTINTSASPNDAYYAGSV